MPAIGAGSTTRRSPPSTCRAPRWTSRFAVARATTSISRGRPRSSSSRTAPATREWLGSDMAKRFMHAYRKARAWLIATPAAKVAETESAFFPEIDRAVLASTIAYYQKLGCWTPHVEISRPAFEVALDVFQHSGLITKRHRYEDVVAAPPDVA